MLYINIFFYFGFDICILNENYIKTTRWSHDRRSFSQTVKITPVYVTAAPIVQVIQTIVTYYYHFCPQNETDVSGAGTADNKLNKPHSVGDFTLEFSSRSSAEYVSLVFIVSTSYNIYIYTCLQSVKGNATDRLTCLKPFPWRFSCIRRLITRH